MRYYRSFAGVILFGCCFLFYSLQIHFHFETRSLSLIDKSVRHTAIILARKPSIKILKHLNALVNIGVNAFVMCDENPWKYVNITERILYVNDESLVQYGLQRNFVWDRVFIWLYNQSSLDYVWLMEDDLTWIHPHSMMKLFDKYANNQADLLARNIIYRNNQTLKWMWWPKSYLQFFPEEKWSGSLNMLSRVSRRLIQAHRYYTLRLLDERHSLQIDSNYYFQEFFLPTVGHMFNLTMTIYDHSNMNIHVLPLNEDAIRKSLANGKEIFHPVKHQSELLIHATS